MTVNGVNLAVEVRATGRPSCSSTAIRSTGRIWAHQLDALDGLRRIAPDLRGMGQSDAPDLGYSMATYAGGPRGAARRARRSTRWCSAGLSMGGYIAFEFLRRWRRRVRGLVLMDTRAEADSPEGRRARDAAAAPARERGAAADRRGACCPTCLAPDTLRESPERRRAGAGHDGGYAGGRHRRARSAAMRDRPDSTDAAAHARRDCRPSCIVGADDRLTPPRPGPAMAEAIPGLALAVIPGPGHLPPLERPADDHRAMREFLESLP